MIIVITVKEKNELTGREELIVSHGINNETDDVVILPNVAPERIGATFNNNIGEYIIAD